MEKSHRCIERLVDCDCPICGDYLFSSTKSVVFMRCGHSIHQTCYDSHRQVSYRCPICAKSLFNMETQFRNLDIAIQNQPMPPEFRDTRAIISCNDCLAKSSVKYHWLGLKCAICNSYNTAEHQILAGPDRGVPNRPSDAGDGEAQGVATAAQLRPQTQALSSAPDSTTGAAAASLPREVILRRRHSSNVSALGSYQPPERLAKSVSPPQMSHASSAADVSDGHEDDSEDVEDDDDEGSDILAFWGRDNEVRSVRSAEDMTLGSGEGRGRDAKDHLDGEEGEEEEGESDGEEDDLDDEDEDDDEDDDDDEEDEIVLVGHR